MITCGVDAGSRIIKLVLYDGDRRAVLARGLAEQDVDQARQVAQLYGKLLAENGLVAKQVGRVLATGAGRNNLTLANAADPVTEITCHARGVQHQHPETRMIIEIGGQDSKVIWLDESGRVRDFAMNDRCAAGTGQFLEMVSRRFNVPLAEMGERAGRSTAPAPISSMCAVFAETEILGLLAAGTPLADVIAGVQRSVAARVAALAGRKAAMPVRFTGGVALVPGMAAALAAAFNAPVALAAEPQYTGALGAALLASAAIPR